LSLPLVRFGLLDGISHAVGTRHGGVSTPPYHSLNLGYATADDEAFVAENRRRFIGSAGLGQKHVVSARISHGKRVRVFRASDRVDGGDELAAVRSGSRRHEHFFYADAAVTDRPDLALLLSFGDCVPMAFADTRLGVVGAAHAGWRGTAVGIAAEVVRVMDREFGSNPGDIVVGIGPSIGPCCYSVDTSVVDTFRANGSDLEAYQRDGRTMLDLWATNERHLTDAGVRSRNIENVHVCTSCNVDAYFSHRAERGTTGRFGLIVSGG
jgi:YfiH family protein